MHSSRKVNQCSSRIRFLFPVGVAFMQYPACCPGFNIDYFGYQARIVFMTKHCIWLEEECIIVRVGPTKQITKCMQNTCRHSEVTWLGKIYTSAMLGPVKGWHAHALEWFSFLELLFFPSHETRDCRELIRSLPVQVLDLPLNTLMFSWFLFPTKQINVS